MKKILVSITLLIGSFVSAQNLTDALRYSVEDLNGTARYRAMSGAFGALGGDFSAVNVNPAGSAVFAGSEIGFSLGNISLKNENTYFGTKTDNKSSDFNIGQFGFVFNIPNYNQNSEWKKFSLTFNYQNTRNFDANDLSFSGTTTGVNLGDYFNYFANGIQQQNLMLVEYDSQKQVSGVIYLQDLYDSYSGARLHNPFNLRNALLGYTVGLIQPASGKREINPSMSDAEATSILEETTYVKNIADNTSTQQVFDRITKGGVRKYNFNFATQYGDNLFLGVSLNSHTVDYKSLTRHREFYTNNTTNISNAYFENELNTSGSGFSFQLGAIFKATDNLRLGASYQSPTWYSLQDEMAQYLRATASNNEIYYANPLIVVIYPTYKFRTAGSWTASAAYVFGKNAIISLDYIYKGYGDTYFRTDYLKSENDIIKNELGDSNAIRLGGEYRFILNQNNSLSLRAGYRYEQSPYKNTKYIGDLSGYSFGAGFAFSGVRLDVSYDIAKQDNQYQMYESVLTTPVKVASTRNNLLFTLSAKLF